MRVHPPADGSADADADEAAGAGGGEPSEAQVLEVAEMHMRALQLREGRTDEAVALMGSVLQRRRLAASGWRRS